MVSQWARSAQKKMVFLLNNPIIFDCPHCQWGGGVGVREKKVFKPWFRGK